MNGVLADWKQKRAFDLLADLEHMFGTEAIENDHDLLSKAGQRIWEECEIYCPSTVHNLITSYQKSDGFGMYEILKYYGDRMGGKFKKDSWESLESSNAWQNMKQPKDMRDTMDTREHSKQIQAYVTELKESGEW